MPAFSRRIQGPPAGFFDACIAFQLSTTEIVVYSLSVGQFVVVAWYVARFFTLFVLILLQAYVQRSPDSTSRFTSMAAFAWPPLGLLLQSLDRYSTIDSDRSLARW